VFNSDSEIGGVIRQNGPLVIAIAVLLAGAAIVYSRGESEAVSVEGNLDAVMQQNALRAANGEIKARPQRKTPQELAQEQIAEHEATIEANPDSEDTPAYLMAMGNLYRQKMLDYEKAAECYERILKDYPDWNNVRLIYMQLATCYDRMENKEKARDIYKQMLDVFPEGTNEHDIAHAAVFR